MCVFFTNCHFPANVDNLNFLPPHWCALWLLSFFSVTKLKLSFYAGTSSGLKPIIYLLDWNCLIDFSFVLHLHAPSRTLYAGQRLCSFAVNDDKTFSSLLWQLQSQEGNSEPQTSFLHLGHGMCTESWVEKQHNYPAGEHDIVLSMRHSLWE